MKAATIALRDVPPRAAWALEQAGLTPLLARLFAGRGVRLAEELDDALARLIPPGDLLGAAAAAARLADALENAEPIVVVADYDCDGATACAVAVRGLKLLGAQPGQVRHVVPDRAVHGYGLTPTIVDLALQLLPRPKLLITVDNGIASIDGVAHARAQGLGVIVTDHHLPALIDGQTVLPDADVIVNPNQPDCHFASKQLAGVGVMFYVLLALRSELRDRGRFDAQKQPRLDSLLDLVALGTVADVVRLDANNRRLVAQGLKRIRSGRLNAGVAALFAVASRDPGRASAFEFGFALGPRINAAGRLSDMSLGIECLLCDDPSRAAELAARLDAINRERRDVEAGMREQAEGLLEALLPADDELPALTLYDPGFHEGVVGIVASRMKDRLNRPSFVFARGQDGLLKGSGRSIAGFHLRDALDLLSKRHPGVLRKFGGHAMAAGCTLAESELPTFRDGFALIASEWLTPDLLSRTVLSDGPLGAEFFNVATVTALDEQVWGQAFEAPVFCDVVDIVSQRLVGDKHLKLSVRHAGALRDAIWFGHSDPLPARVRLAYRINLDEYNGRQRIQMMVEAAVPV